MLIVLITDIRVFVYFICVILTVGKLRTRKMADIEAVELAREGVLKRLHCLEDTKDLTEICQALNTQIPPSKKGKRSAIFNLILRGLTDPELDGKDDGGLEIIQDISDIVELKIKAAAVKIMVDPMKLEIGNTSSSKDKEGEVEGLTKLSQLEKEMSIVTEAMKHQSMSQPLVRDAPVSAPAGGVRTNVVRLEKFKVHGGTVGGGKNRLDFKSLVHQIEEAKGLGHSFKEIMSGVVRAMEAGSGLKRWFEKRPDVTEERAMRMLRCHYELNVRDALTLLTELKDVSQEPTEDVKEYVLRMMDYRDSIMDLAEEEECPLSEALVNKRFYQALSVGITADVIRLDLRQVLKDASMEDWELLEEINVVVNRYEEHKRKQRPRNARVNNLNSDDAESEKVVAAEEFETNKMILSELKKLNKGHAHLTAQVNELSTVKEELADLKKKFSEQKKDGNGGGGDGGRRKPYVKCDDCEKKGAFCKHCTICGSLNHKRNKCPDKPKN